MSPLSRRTLEIIDCAFPAEVQQRVRQLLESECSREALGCDGWSEGEMERIWFAVLKLGSGDVSGLEDAIALARTDRRDLLMAAGFGEDLNAHTMWAAHACRRAGRLGQVAAMHRSPPGLMARFETLLEYYRAALTAAEADSPASELQLYRAHWSALNRLEQALSTDSRTEALRVVSEQRRAFGWSYLSGEGGRRAESAFHALATALEQQA